MKPIVIDKPAQSASNGAIYENVSIRTVEGATAAVVTGPATSHKPPAKTPAASLDARAKKSPATAAKTRSLKRAESPADDVGDNQSSGLTDDEEGAFDDDAIYANQQTCSVMPPTAIRLDQLRDVVLQKLRSGSLPAEFSVRTVLRICSWCQKGGRGWGGCGFVGEEG